MGEADEEGRGGHPVMILLPVFLGNWQYRLAKRRT